MFINVAKYIFDYDYNLCKNNWCSDLKEIMINIEMLDVFIGKRKCNITHAMEKIDDIIHSSWSEEVFSKPKLRTYIKYKTSIGVESYVSNFYNRKSRSLMAQFRCGILPLHVETGRYVNLDADERICEFCKTNQIEDELHFICQCSLYARERMALYNDIRGKIGNFDNLTSEQKFCEIVKNCQRELSQYICKAWDVRQQRIFR